MDDISYFISLMLSVGLVISIICTVYYWPKNLMDSPDKSKNK